MANENNLDKLFRDHLYHRDVDFNPKDWEAAEKLITQDEKKRTCFLGVKTVVILLSLMLIGLGGAYWLFNDSANEPADAADQLITTVVSEPEKETTLTENPAENIKSPENTFKTQSAESLTLAATSSETGKNATQEELSKPVIQTTIKHAPGTIDAEFTSKNRIDVNHDPESKSIRKTGDEIGKMASAGIESTNTKPESASAEDINKKTNSSLDKNEMEHTGNFPPGNNEPGRSTNNEAEPIIRNSTHEDPETDILLPSVITLNKESTPVDEKPAESNSENKTEITTPLKDRLNWLRHVSIGLTGGVTTSQGFLNTGANRAGISAAPSAGLRLTYLMNEQVDLESGLSLNYRNGLNSKITYLTSRDFNNNISYYTTQSSLALLYMDFPLHLTYKYTKHSFIVGMQYGQLINTRTEMADIKETGTGTTVEQTNKHWEKNDGRFSSFDLAGLFGYDFSITDRIKIGARYNLGLFDVTDDNFFGNSVRDKNNQLRIFAEYKILKY